MGSRITFYNVLLHRCRNSKIIEKIDSFLNSENKYFICHGFCLSWNFVWLKSRADVNHYQERMAGPQGAGPAARSGAASGSALLAAFSAAQQSWFSGFASVQAGWHALLQALGSELGWVEESMVRAGIWQLPQGNLNQSLG